MNLENTSLAINIFLNIKGREALRWVGQEMHTSGRDHFYHSVILGCPVQGQNLDSMILWDSSHSGDSRIP